MYFGTFPHTGTTQRPVVAYLGGLGRSGSTLLTRVIGQLPDAVSVGEQTCLWNEGVRNNQVCGCGQPFQDCELWSEVGRLAFGGWNRVDVDEMWRLRERVRTLRHFPLWVKPSLTKSSTRDADAYCRSAVRVYAAIAEASGSRIVVDNSKGPNRATLLRAAPEIDLRVIHLVRSSYGVCYSWSKEVERSDAPGRRMQQRSAARCAAQWVAANTGFEVLAKLGVPRLVVRYEDFIADPRGEAIRIFDFLGARYTADDLSYIGDGVVDLLPDHSIWGNPTRLQSGPVTLRPDDAWREALTPQTRRVITGITAPMMRRYGYRETGRSRRGLQPERLHPLHAAARRDTAPIGAGELSARADGWKITTPRPVESVLET